jgi:hypothetical protein
MNTIYNIDGSMNMNMEKLVELDPHRWYLHLIVVVGFESF